MLVDYAGMSEPIGMVLCVTTKSRTANRTMRFSGWFRRPRQRFLRTSVGPAAAARRPHRPRQPPATAGNVCRSRTTAPTCRPAVSGPPPPVAAMATCTCSWASAHIRPADGVEDDDLSDPNLGPPPEDRPDCGTVGTAAADHPGSHLSKATPVDRSYRHRRPHRRRRRTPKRTPVSSCLM